MPILSNILQSIEAEGIFPNPFTEAIYPTPNQEKTLGKQYRPVSLINNDEKTLNKILADQIKKSSKRIIYHDQRRFISGTQG